MSVQVVVVAGLMIAAAFLAGVAWSANARRCRWYRPEPINLTPRGPPPPADED